MKVLLIDQLADGLEKLNLMKRRINTVLDFITAQLKSLPRDPTEPILIGTREGYRFFLVFYLDENKQKPFAASKIRWLIRFQAHSLEALARKERIQFSVDAAEKISLDDVQWLYENLSPVIEKCVAENSVISERVKIALRAAEAIV